MFKTSILPLLFACIAICMSSIYMHAEGTAELAPNDRISINGNVTHDIAALHIASSQYFDFAERGNNDPLSRLYVHINDPDSESLFLGFSRPHRMNSNEALNVDMWLVDPAGRDVFGPFRLDDEIFQIDDRSQAVAGPNVMNDQGYQAIEIDSETLSSRGWSGSGDYYIEFRNRSNGLSILFDYWDITVAESSGNAFFPKPGRVWAYNWSIFAINDFGFPNRPFNGTFYVCAPDESSPGSGYISRIDFDNSGFRPGAFNFSFNSFGLQQTGIVTEDRKSVESRNLTIPEYAIYLNDPIDICRTASLKSASLIGLTRCGANGFEFILEGDNSITIDILLDFDKGDGIYTPNTADLLIAASIENGNETRLYWDGYDGLGNDLNTDLNATIPLKLLFGQQAYHFPIYDGEYMSNGFRIDRIRPKSDAPVLIYYDDSDIDSESGTGSSLIELNGCAPRCHNWNVFISENRPGYGNRNTINTWWYAHSFESSEILDIPPYFNCSIQGPRSICEKDTAFLQLRPEVFPYAADEPRITGIKWSGPSIVGDTNKLFVFFDGPGTYSAELFWTSENGDQCSNFCEYTVDLIPAFESRIDTIINFGDSLIINNQLYTAEGEYMQNLLSQNGCDSTLIIKLGFDIPELTIDCQLEQEEILCEGASALITAGLIYSDSLLINTPRNIEWRGPDFNRINDYEILAEASGRYEFMFEYLDYRDSLRQSNCFIDVESFPSYTDSFPVSLIEGESYINNGVEYHEEGEYIQHLISKDGCDSTLIITIIGQKLPLPEQYIKYDFNDCRSSDYSLLTASTQNDCGNIRAFHADRENAITNPHSCTAGVEGEAICIASIDACEIDSSSFDQALKFRILFTPEASQSFNFQSLQFFQKAPEFYQWTTGQSGPNNYPAKFGLEISVNGQIVYSERDRNTNNAWQFEYFNLSDVDSLVLDGNALLEISLLPYCTKGIDSNVSAWDIDELYLAFECEEASNRSVSGAIKDARGNAISEVRLALQQSNAEHINQFVDVDENGEFQLKLPDAFEGKLIFSKQDLVLNRLSTLDAAIIQSHVSGVNTLDSSLKKLAADLNQSGTISVEDIELLKSIILETKADELSEDQWLFVIERHTYDPQLNTIAIDGSDEAIQLKVTGVKIGDVSGQ